MSPTPPMGIPAGCGTLLLTGATGLLGGQILIRLIIDGKRDVACLIRGSDGDRAVRRGEQRLAVLLGRQPTDDERSRVTWIHGDLDQRDLGLSDEHRSRLTGTVDEILHCAADVRFGTAEDQSYRTNVDGTRRLLDVAHQCDVGRFRRFHHVSTAYAAGCAPHSVVAGYLPTDEPRRFRNGYERSKAAAERMLRSDARVPVTVYRPSIIVGDSVTGWTEAFNVLYDPMRRMADNVLPFLPCGGDARLDCVPVDHVADAIIALAQRSDTADTTLHITAGREAIDVPEFVAQVGRGIARRSGGSPPDPPRRVPRLAWISMRRCIHALAASRVRLGRARRTVVLADRLFDSFEPFERYGWVDTDFDTTRECDLLARCGVHLAPVQEWFPTIVDHALAVDFARDRRRHAGSQVAGSVRRRSTEEAGAASVHTSASSRRADLGYQAGLLGFVRPANTARMARYATGVRPSRLGRLGYLAASGAIGTPLRALERRRHGAVIDETDVRKPVFVIGHWRSGTTHLHNLLARDHRFGYVSMYQALAPDFSLVAERWLRPALARTVPVDRPMDNMVWPLDAPQEEEIPLAKTAGYSFYLQFLFPQACEELFTRYVLFDGPDAEVLRARWERSYRHLLEVATVRSGGRRLVLKNPANTARVRHLLDLYPDARFVCIHRDPFEVFPSACNLHRRTLRLTALQDVDEDLIRNNVLRLYELTMRRYLVDRRSIPDDRLVEISYEDLDRDPVGTVGDVYARLGISGFDEVRPAIADYVDSQRGYVKNSFELTADDIATVADRWGFAFEALDRPGRDQVPFVAAALAGR